jgi:hypothetical protein
MKITKRKGSFAPLVCSDNIFTLISPDEMIKATVIRFRTEDPPPEVLDLEWNRLKPIDQYDELAAVVFDLATQEKAKEIGLQIPSIESLEKWLDVIEEGELSGNESEVRDNVLMLP